VSIWQILVNNILDIARIDSGERKIAEEVFNVRKMAKETLNPLILLSNKKFINLVYSFSDNLPENIITDRLSLKQIIINIVNNAVKYTKEGIIEVKISNNRNSLFITVKDSGIGIPKEKINLIFDRFTRVDNCCSKKQKGFGLGLSIVKELVVLMNGKISVKSIMGKGTIFVVKIPVKFEAESNILETKNTYVEKTKRINILVVDDNEDILGSFHIGLEEYGYEHTLVNSSSEALKLYKNNKYDLVISDIIMPKMDGIELLKEIKKYNPNAKVVLMTGSSDLEETIIELKDDIIAYFLKPAVIHEIVLIIQEIEKEMYKINILSNGLCE